ncbi:MAG: flagellar hook-basal body complex protein [Butyrivibrio sp.]|nr:flagellar hook-basal body complex protein [Butyrivibrio sp.]
MIIISGLTGSYAATVSYGKPGVVETPYPNANTSYKKAYPAKKFTFTGGDFEIGEPSYVFKSSDTDDKYSKSYYLVDDKRDFESLNADFLSDVFGVSLSNNVNYSISFDDTGLLTVTHMQTAQARPIADSDFSVEAAEGMLKFSSKSAYKNVPVTGNISDLLSSVKSDSTGKTEGLLSKVYGIGDKAAAAFGSDGTYEINPADGKITLTVGNRTIQLQFDEASGTIISADGDKVSKTANITFGLNGQDTEGLMAFGFQANAANADEMKRNHTISIDFSTITNYNTSKSSTIKALKGDTHSLNTGRAVGEMNGINISDNGEIYANYSNGQTKLLGQIASAEFANASGLSKQGDNLYSSTLNSGEATIQDITTDGGYMSTGVLEMSNVDLSAQFTEMITTQRGFQANSRIITVSDTLLEELTNLKR